MRFCFILVFHKTFHTIFSFEFYTLYIKENKKDVKFCENAKIVYENILK